MANCLLDLLEEEQSLARKKEHVFDVRVEKMHLDDEWRNLPCEELARLREEIAELEARENELASKIKSTRRAILRTIIRYLEHEVG